MRRAMVFRRRNKILLAVLAGAMLLAAVSAASFGLAGRAGETELFEAVLHTVERDYVDPDRINPRKMIRSALEAVERAVPEVLVDIGKADSNHIQVTVGLKKAEFSLSGVGTDSKSLDAVGKVFTNVFNFIKKWGDPEVELKDVEYAAINGMLSTLDPHSVYMNQEQYKEMKISTSGNFGGLGIVITIRNGSLTIISPIEGTPASKAGLKAKDEIVAINGESTVNMPLTEAVQKLRGEPGTSVTIAVLRKGWNQPKDFTIVRAIIKIKSVKSKLLEGGVGLVKITSFQGNTTRDLKKALSSFKARTKHGLKGLVLDLRNNPGGLLRQAVYVADTFLDRGVIVSRVGPGGRPSGTSYAQNMGTEPKYPMVILVNGGSASASEIVSGALKNHDRALVLGERTFGKGTVQVLYDARKQLFVDDESALKLTVEKYLTPGGISIQKVGITPDVRVIPEYVDERGVDLEPDTNRRREENLEEALGEGKKKPAKTKPALEIRYLAPLEREDDVFTSEQTKEAEVDFEVEAARQLILGAKGWKRTSLIRQAPRIWKPLLASERKKLEDALATAGVDWSMGLSRGKANLSARLEVGEAVDQTWDMENEDKKPSRKPRTCEIKPGTEGSSIRAGKVACLKLTVHNRGPATVYRLHGMLECIKCDSSAFDQVEFILGKVTPGKSREWTVPVKVPNSQLTQYQELEVHFKEPRGRLPKVVRKTVKFEGLPRPFFSYSYSFSDPPPGGNGDGLVEVGESVSLELELANEGKGPALKPLVLVENKVGNSIFLEKGRVTLEKPVPPGGSTSVSFSFQAKSLPGKKGPPLELFVRDLELDEFMKASLPFEIMSPVNATVTARNGWVSVISDTSLYSGASNDAQVMGIVPAGTTVRMTGEIGGFYRIKVQGAKKNLAGFIHSSSVRPVPAVQNTGTFVAAPFRKPPRIEIDAKGPVLVDGDFYTLKGRAVDDNRLKDVYIFNGDKKVFFSAIPAADGNAPEITFDVAVPLKEGDNLLTIVARESKDFFSRRFMIVRKQVHH